MIGMYKVQDVAWKEDQGARFGQEMGVALFIVKFDAATKRITLGRFLGAHIVGCTNVVKGMRMGGIVIPAGGDVKPGTRVIPIVATIRRDIPFRCRTLDILHHRF